MNVWGIINKEALFLIIKGCCHLFSHPLLSVQKLNSRPTDDFSAGLSDVVKTRSLNADYLLIENQWESVDEEFGDGPKDIVGYVMLCYVLFVCIIRIS